jgi:hypothetical protein
MGYGGTFPSLRMTLSAGRNPDAKALVRSGDTAGMREGRY